MGRAEQDRAVRPAVDHDVARAEPHRPQRRAAAASGRSSSSGMRHGLVATLRSASMVHGLRRALLQERLEPRLGLVVALRDRRDQRLGQIAAGRIGFGDARQHVHDGEIGHRRIAGDALGELDALGEAGAGLHQVVRQADRLALLGAVGAAGQHHVHHARGADQPRHPHRAAAADEDAAAAFRQRVIGRALGHPDMAGGRELEPAADHRAVQHRHHRHLAEFDPLEHAVPVARMRDALRRRCAR